MYHFFTLIITMCAQVSADSDQDSVTNISMQYCITHVYTTDRYTSPTLPVKHMVVVISHCDKTN